MTDPARFRPESLYDNPTDSSERNRIQDVANTLGIPDFRLGKWAAASWRSSWSDPGIGGLGKFARYDTFRWCDENPGPRLG